MAMTVVALRYTTLRRLFAEAWDFGALAIFNSHLQLDETGKRNLKVLRPGFEDQIEGRLRRAAKMGEPALGDDFANFLFAPLCPYREPNFLR
jgi:hypothetical protein